MEPLTLEKNVSNKNTYSLINRFSCNCKMLSNWLFLVFSCLFLNLLNVESWEIKERIVGGSSAVEKQFSHQVSVRDKRNDVHFCGGVIINSRFILTAAHCFFDRPLNSSLIYGVVNITHASDFGSNVDFMNVRIHPDFGKRSAEPDLGLIESKREIFFSQFVHPINLPTQDAQPGISAVISGWGSIRVRFEN